VGQTLASLLFVVLYVWSTYDAPAPGSPRALADAALCVAFATDYVVRFVVRREGREGKGGRVEAARMEKLNPTPPTPPPKNRTPPPKRA
jgi:hypothetical protein